jgi:hypothetical protein
MKVKELILKLSQEDSEAQVIVSCDEEGNRFSPLDESFDNNAVYDTLSKEVRLHHLTPALKKQGFTIEDVYDGEMGTKALVLYPTI